MREVGEFDGRVVVVTGGASGIGKAVSLVLADRGARVVIGDVSPEGGEAVAATIRRNGGESVFVRTDVSDEASVSGLIGRAVDTYGGLNLAFNNAGVIHPPARLHEMPLTDLDRAYAVNVRGIALCLRAELRHMVDNGGGSIVNTASGAGLTATPMQPAYTMSKHAIVGLTRAAATDYAASGIRVNAIALGLIETPMTAPLPKDVREMIIATTPQGRMGTATEVANAAVFLLDDRAGYVNGAVLSIDGGLTAHN